MNKPLVGGKENVLDAMAKCEIIKNQLNVNPRKENSSRNNRHN